MVFKGESLQRGARSHKNGLIMSLVFIYWLYFAPQGDPLDEAENFLFDTTIVEFELRGPVDAEAKFIRPLIPGQSLRSFSVITRRST